MLNTSIDLSYVDSFFFDFTSKFLYKAVIKLQVPEKYSFNLKTAVL